MSEVGKKTAKNPYLKDTPPPKKEIEESPSPQNSPDSAFEMAMME